MIGPAMSNLLLHVFVVCWLGEGTLKSKNEGFDLFGADIPMC